MKIQQIVYKFLDIQTKKAQKKVGENVYPAPPPLQIKTVREAQSPQN